MNDELNTAMNAGIIACFKRDLTAREVALLRAALNDAHPQVRKNAEDALRIAGGEGRLPKEPAP